MRLPPFLTEKESLMDHADASRLKRRRFLRQACSSTLLATAGIGITGCRSTGANWNEPVTASFLHGVASGDPLTDRIILWTRVTPHDPDEDRDVIVHWQIALDKNMQNIVVMGDITTGPDHDYTVKVDAAGLQAGKIYFYRFSAGTAHSPIGRTKTLPSTDAAQIKLAVFSCSNYPAGYFNVYADAAKQDSLDAALHIGDYIYEYESTGYACDHAKELGRISDPENLLLVLNDYRRRYAQYRTDPDLQAVHAHLPFIPVWDDHEFADDAWRDGSADHKPTMEGPFSLRKASAIRAYHEWMPIRLPDPHNPEKIYRSFDFGKLVSLHMLDTRMIGRDQQLMMSSYYDENEEFDEKKYRADIASPHRQMMGEEQIAWLERSVRNSKAAWQIIGQQVLMARMEYPLPIAMGEISCADYAKLKEQAQHGKIGLTPQQQSCLAAPMLPCYLDSWDGYQNDREKLFSIMRRHNKNM
ncbi:MAG: alkaline phosphatase D family protein, partial [Burkholderiaceae bacterium]